MPYVVAIIISYFLGCSNMALYIGKAKGIDLRAGGSGNLGTCNALMLMGWKNAVLVCVHDIGKAVLSVLLSKWLFPDAPLIGYVAGVACVIGHIFPFYLKFKGGKGFASFLGMALALNWRFGIALLLTVGLLMLITDYIVTGTVATVVAYPLYIGILTADWRPVLILCIAAAAILIKHRGNCMRIWNGTEPRVRKVVDKKG